MTQRPWKGSLAPPWGPYRGVLDTQLHFQPQALAGLWGATEDVTVPEGTGKPLSLGRRAELSHLLRFPVRRGGRASGSSESRVCAQRGRDVPNRRSLTLLPDLSPSASGGLDQALASSGGGKGRQSPGEGEPSTGSWPWPLSP